MSSRVFIKSFLIFVLLLVPVSAVAQGGSLLVTVTPMATCADADFEVDVQGGTGDHELSWTFGDGEVLVEPGVVAFPHLTSHMYPGRGDYDWLLEVTDSLGNAGMSAGTLAVGPTVSLTSDVFPPIYTLVGGAVTANFTADVTGGAPPYTYMWDLDGDGNPDPGSDPTSNTSSFTYTAGGKFQATVTVTDACGLTHTATLTVLIIDPDEVCHPMAQRIANAVSSLFPDQAEQLYTCEDIFNIFQGGLTGFQVGFGRMWHAYNLALKIEELTWEEIRDWHLAGSGWGKLLQLDRFAEVLDDFTVRDLMEQVLSGQTTIKEIRTAVRMATRYDADFEEVLDRLGQGYSPGKLGQFYRTAQELGVDPETLAGYLDMGLSVSELRHAANVAQRTGGDWAAVAEAHAMGHSWGAIQQAYRMADADTDAAAILDLGVKEYRRQLREENRAQRQTEHELDHNQLTAARVASQFGVSAAEVMAVFDGACDGDWSCVRAHFRDLQRVDQGAGAKRGGKGGGPPEGKGKNKNK